jgi:hypothetical protein
LARDILSILIADIARHRRHRRHRNRQRIIFDGLRRCALAILAVKMQLGKCAGSLLEGGFPMTAMTAITRDRGDT